MTLRQCLQTLLTFKGTDYTQMDTRKFIDEGRKVLFDYDYHIFDEAYRPVFETNFIRYFYMREIGFETEGLFKFQLESWLLLNMPYFNKMFESELITFDPLVNSEMTNESTRTTDKDGTVNTTTNGDVTSTNNQTANGTKTDDDFSRILEADTPDNRLQLTTQDGSGVLEYASKITEGTENNTSNTTNTVNGSNTESSNVTGNTVTGVNEIEGYIQTRTGKIGAVSYSKMLMEYRESLVRVEKKMFEEMQQLFMLVY